MQSAGTPATGVPLRADASRSRKCGTTVSHTWGAVQFTDSLPPVLLPLGSLWGAAMGLFSYSTLRLAKPRQTPFNGAAA